MSNNVLSVTGLEKSFGARLLFEDVTFGLDRGVKIGVIGANGAGKSTLLKIIDGQEDADQGLVVVRGGCKIAFLEQEPTLIPGATIRQVLEEPLAHLKAAMESGDLEKSEELGAWDWEHRLERAAGELGVEDLDEVVDVLSGGQRKRVALARLMLLEADVLLLDEPTNHLDTETADWLERWLSSSPAAAMVVTHDRYFLDRVVDSMAEVRDGALRVYEGNYTDYLEARAVEEAHRGSVRKRRLQLLKTELEWARRSPKARTTKSKARLGRLDTAKVEQRRLSAEELVADFRFGDPPRLGKTILELVAVEKSFGKEPLVDGLSMIVRRGERFGIIGPNGCGKSTLLKMIAGTLQPDSGSLKRGSNTEIAWLDQQRTILDPNATVRGTVLPDGGEFVFPGGQQRVHVSGWLQRFAFTPDSHQAKVSSLSGGERNRLAIARFLLDKANLLLLDEPTNDIDLVTANVLEEALARFEGCVMVVSHDRFFLDKIATGIIAFEDEVSVAEGEPRVNLIQGDYTHYQRVRLKRLEERRDREAARRVEEKRAVRASKLAGRESKPGLTWADKQELEGIEDVIMAADEEVDRLQALLADGSLWATDHEAAKVTDTHLKAAEAERDRVYARWEDLESR
jgi:ATP-binding cassette subfamily F protein uup